MSCTDEGRLMAYLDGQLPPGESGVLAAHLDGCATCRQALDRLAREKEEAARLLAGFERATQSLPAAAPPRFRGAGPEGRPGDGSVGAEDGGRAGTRSHTGDVSVFNNERGASAENRRRASAEDKKGAASWMRIYYRWVAAAVVVGLLFSYAPARTLASQFLSVFRVERVQVMHFDPRDIALLEEALRGRGDVDIRNFGRVESEPLTAMPRVSVELPAAVGDYVREHSTVRPGELVKITPDVEGVNRFLHGLGGGTLLPPELSSKTFEITVPEVAQAWYRHRETGDYIGFSRCAAPTLDVPPGVPVAAVRQALLDVPILPPGLKQALEGIEDWTRTLPFPDFTGQAREVVFDGAPGLFVQGREHPHHAGGRTVPEDGSAPDGAAARHPAPDEYYGPTLLAWYRDGLWTLLECPPGTAQDVAFGLARQLEAAW